MKKISSILFVLLTSMTISQASIITGTCGNNLSWSLNTKDSTLTIEGSGNMNSYDNGYTNKRTPWYEYRSYIAYVNLPNDLTNIGTDAFSYCENLKSIGISNKVRTIGKRAFSCCYNLSSVQIPNSVTSIEERAFYDCHKLDSITIPNSVTSIKGSAFYGCFNMISVAISQNISTIEDFTFRICTHLKSVNIPDGVTSIGQGAFHRCLDLETIEIGSGVKTVKKEAFSECTKLKSLTCHAITPPSCESDPFLYVTNIKSIPLYVPTESVEAYSNALWWEDFNIMPIGSSHEGIDSPPCIGSSLQKVLKNGHIYILKDNKTYTITGIEVK